MGQIYFTTIELIKENTLIDQNVSEKTLKVMLSNAQSLDLQELLGTNLYKLLLKNISSGSLSSKQRVLIEEYLLPYLYSLIESMALDDLLFKISDSIYSSNPQYTQNADKARLQSQKVNKDRAVNFLAGLLKTFIENNIKDFPEYKLYTEGIPAKKVQNFGFFVDDQDFYDDDQYNQRRSINGEGESI